MRLRWLRNRRVQLALGLALVALIVAAGVALTLIPGDDAPGQLVILGESDRTIEGGHFTSTEGPCIEIRHSQRITIRNAEIGPCGGQAIIVFGSDDVTIVDSYLHPEFPVTMCCDRGDAIFGQLVNNLTIQGNVIAFGETNIELMSVTDVLVRGNFLLNPLGPFPRGQQVQIGRFGDNPPSERIVIDRNYAIAETSEHPFSARQEDAINIGSSLDVRVTNNYIVGGQSASGCGIIADREASGVWIEGNILHETANCGIGITTGEGNRVLNNRVLNTEEIGGSSAIYVWDIYGDEMCNDVLIADNITYSINTGYIVDLGGCTNVDVRGHTSGDEALALLTPFVPQFPPPAIPPEPFEEIAKSPFTTAAENR